MEEFITKESFLNCFNRNVYNKIIKETTVEIPVISYSEYKNCLAKLYEKLAQNNYSPLSPETYVLIPKTEHVARTIPILNFQDESFYYFVCKILENEIAENRVANTFGGWRLGNSLKAKEQEDIADIQYVYNSYNPALWSKEWKEFVNISRAFVNSGEFKYVIKLDISNFYDSINLNILFNKLNQKVSKEKFWCIQYLMYFLKYWNKKIDDYQPRSTGLPQTEFGDQSRLLANFYLQDYDLAVKNICEKMNAEYVRYADDQLIFLRDDNSQEIILTVNRELNRLGLNLNAAKCKMLTIEELSELYLYESLALLDENKYDESFDLFKRIYIRNEGVRFDTYLKRILNEKIGLKRLNIENRSYAKTILFDKKFLLYCNSRILNLIYLNCQKDEQQEYVKMLVALAGKTKFNV